MTRRHATGAPGEPQAGGTPTAMRPRTTNALGTHFARHAMFARYSLLNAYTVRDLNVSPGRSVVVGNDGWLGESG